MRKRVNNIKESDQYETAFMTKKKHKINIKKIVF